MQNPPQTTLTSLATCQCAPAFLPGNVVSDVFCFLFSVRIPKLHVASFIFTDKSIDGDTSGVSLLSLSYLPAVQLPNDDTRASDLLLQLI